MTKSTKGLGIQAPALRRPLFFVFKSNDILGRFWNGLLFGCLSHSEYTRTVTNRFFRLRRNLAARTLPTSILATTFLSPRNPLHHRHPIHQPPTPFTKQIAHSFTYVLPYHGRFPG